MVLKRLLCENNNLTELPPLPEGLKLLYCNNNQLTSLPVLPASLEDLNCSFNQLTTLPVLQSQEPPEPENIRRIPIEINLNMRSSRRRVIYDYSDEEEEEEEDDTLYSEDEETLYSDEEDEEDGPFPIQRNTEHPDGEICSICYNTMLIQENNTQILQCSHMFHENCITQWFNTNRRRRCPICRTRN